MLMRAMKSSLQLNHDLDQFRDAHLAQSGFMARAERWPSIPSGAAIPEASTPPSLDATAFRLEGLTLTWAALKLFLMYVSGQIVLKTARLVSHLPPQVQPSVKILCEQVAAFSNDAARIDVGHGILQSIPLLLHGSRGHFDSSRAIFPLTAALLQFGQSQPELEICRTLKAQIARGKGFRFAGGVESISSVFPP
jgi:hypothetical protein